METNTTRLTPTQQRVADALALLERQEGIQFRATYEAENLRTGKKFTGTGTFILPASLETDETFEYASGNSYYVIPKNNVQWVKENTSVDSVEMK